MNESNAIAAVWPAVGMAAVAMVGTIVNYITQYLKERDKQANDLKLALDKQANETKFALDKQANETKFALLEEAQKRCLDDHQECKEETAKLHEKLEASAKDRAELHDRVTGLEAKVAST